MRTTTKLSRILTALATLALVFGGVTACADDDGTEQAGAVYTFVDDDLCEWVTADEIAEYFGSVYDWEGTVEDLPAGDLGEDECSWRLQTEDGAESTTVHANVGDGEGLIGPAEIVAYDGGTVGAGGTVSGHPALSEGVVVQGEGWGIYAFWVPPREEYLGMHLEGSGDVGSVDSEVGADRIEAQTHLFELADLVLRDLGWVS